MLEHACTYPRLFETRPDPDTSVMRLYRRAPHPFVLRAPFEPGESASRCEIEIEFRLIGKAISDLPYAVLAFRQAAERGLGRDRVSMALEDVTDPDGQSVLLASGGMRKVAALPFEPGEAPQSARIRFRTPVRLSRRGALVRPETLNPSDLAMAAVRRAGLLAHFFGERPLDVDFQGLKRCSEALRFVTSTVHWQELSRYSTRQKTRLNMGGMMGEVILDLGEAADLWPFLVLAGQCGLGKAITMGLGDIEVERGE